MIRNKKLQEIDLALNSLVVFRRIMTNDVVLPLRGLLDTETMDPMIQLRKYTEFLSRLYARTTNLSEYIFQLICEDDNFYIRAKAAGREVSDILEACVTNELAILQRFARLRPYELQREVSYYGILPEWETAEIDFGAAYHDRIRELNRYGYGHFVRNPMFTVREGKCVPVKYPHRTALDDLTGYYPERRAVIENIQALLARRHAQHMLLTGDAGTGKSSTVKAVVNAYFDEGLRLIQMTKEQLPQLQDVFDEIHENPLSFIIFLDDVSFRAGDDSFMALKAAIEGSVSERPSNAVICLTSNRRLIVRGTLPEPESGDENRTDTLQELGSLAARFGVQVTFSKPEREAYLETVRFMASREGIEIPPDELECGAEAYAAQVGGRTPRAAKQFIQQYQNRA